jgi:hypothetical protein
MIDDFTFDWGVLAPIELIAAQIEEVCAAHGFGGLWYSSAPDGIPVKGCRITTAAAATLAVVTLQGYAPDQTHLRLQPAARATERAAEVAALADTLYTTFRAAGWLTAEAQSLEHAPRFVRPPGFRPRPGVAGAPT